MNFKNLLLAVAILFSCGIFAQELYSPTNVIQGTFKGKTIPLRDFPTMIVDFNDPSEITIVPNESNTVQEENTTTTVIQNLQTAPGKIMSYALEQNFVGVSQNESGFIPPDPTGAVGPNHYVHSVNSLVKIFDKTGGLLVGPVSLSAFLGNGSNSGDPIVLYDQLADRWLVSEFGAATNSLSIGISETNDPTGAYNVWDYVFPGGFPDYPHYGVWHDGYYGTANMNGSFTQGFVMERDVMLAGGANPQILIFDLPGITINPNQVKSPEPANLLGTTIDPSTPGYITYLQDDAWGGVSFDHLKVWEIEMDWNNTANSTISSPLEIPTDPFDAGELFGNGNGAIHQPGTSQRLAGHGGIVSFGANYRDFGSYNAWLITFNTFIDDNETGGIRWIELRNDAVNPWEIFQEGTYSIADGHSRLMSSSAIDAAGNIALAYTTASATLPVSLRYTGRFNGDPLGQMTLAETTIIDGTGVRTNSNRYGDYSHMTMDPDNFTFWFTADYFSSNNNWRTQVASFSISGSFADDVGIFDIIDPSNDVLTNAETVQVNIRNFGSDSQSNIPLELRVDGNLVASEVFGGSLSANDTSTYTFTQTVDLSNPGQTYTIEVSTNLSGDEFNANDAYTKEVTHLLSNDVGALEITAPESEPGLGMETISFTLKNFGAASQSSFDVQYVIDGGSPVIETFAGPITSEGVESYSFTQQADFSALGTYNLTVSTLLAGDQEPSNNSVSVEIESVLCQPQSNCSLGDGFRAFSVAEINNQTGCEENGYGDFTNLVANLNPGSTYSLSIITGYGSQNVTVWIDFNDDLIFTDDEIVVPNFVIEQGQGAGTYFETVDLAIPANASIGIHRMRARTKRQSVVPNACDNVTYGETEDYTANVGSLGIEDFEISNSDLIVTTMPNNQFEVTLNTEYDGGVFLGIYNVLGQEIGFNKRVPRNNNVYKLKIDMSSMSSGVYFINMGGHGTTSFKTARIIVE